jgi:hypothetical protein
MLAALFTDSARMALVSARKDGMENTAHCVGFQSLFSTRHYHNIIRFFLTAGCENGCSRHGQCTLDNGEYRCDCIEGWAGSDCSIPLEMNCNDNIDNDKGKKMNENIFSQSCLFPFFTLLISLSLFIDLHPKFFIHSLA